MRKLKCVCGRDCGCGSMFVAWSVFVACTTHWGTAVRWGANALSRPKCQARRAVPSNTACSNQKKLTQAAHKCIRSPSPHHTIARQLRADTLHLALMHSCPKRPPASACNSCSENTLPVGLCGVFTTTSRVRLLKAACSSGQQQGHQASQQLLMVSRATRTVCR